MNVPSYNGNNNKNTPLYINELLRLNKGKRVTLYVSYPNSRESQDKVFKGTMITSGDDYIVLKNELNQSLIVWLYNVNYFVFDEEISF